MVRRQCPLCNNTIPVGARRCPWCSGAIGPPSDPGIVLKRGLSAPVTIALITLLLALLAAVIYYNFSHRENLVQVLSGTMKHCPVNGRDYDIDVGKIMVPEDEADKYRVEVMELCPPDVLGDSGLLGSKKGSILIDVTLMTRDSNVSRILVEHPDWEPTTVWFVSKGIPAPGMTKEQIIATWGEPVKTDRFTRGRTVYERWHYGDPLLGVPIQRYAVFKDGLLDDFFEDRNLRDMYNDVISERRAALDTTRDRQEEDNVIYKLFR